MKSSLSPARILLKALCLFVAINILYAVIDPQVSRVSGYNFLFPGRTRLPFGINGDPYTVSVDDVDAMFASHLISAAKKSSEYRVALIGDSSIWGEDLAANEVISEQWNNLNIQCGNKTIRTYDLGYPHPSVFKDLVILDKVMGYQPDLIVWFVTLNTLISQRTNPFLDANHERVAKLLKTYDISFKQSKNFSHDKPGFYEKTLIGQRSNLARQIKLQMLGFVWTATGADINNLSADELPDLNVDDNPAYHGLQPTEDLTSLLSFDAITAGYEIADRVPILVVNEPIFISKGINSSVRYNSLYPRWAYDQYRNTITTQAQSAGWNYLDLWNVAPPEDFSDASLHLNVPGERTLVEQMIPVVRSLGCSQKP